MVLAFALIVCFVLILFWTIICGRVRCMLVSVLLTLFLCLDIYTFADYLPINELLFTKIQKIIIFTLVHGTLGSVALKLLNMGTFLNVQTTTKMISLCLLPYGLLGYSVHISQIYKQDLQSSRSYNKNNDTDDFVFIYILAIFFGLFGMLLYFESTFYCYLKNRVQVGNNEEDENLRINSNNFSTTTTSLHKTFPMAELSEFNQKWTIEDFLHVDFYSGKTYIDSDTFGSDDSGEVQFYLRLYPRGTSTTSNKSVKHQDNISLYLCMRSALEDRLTVAFTCAVLTSSGRLAFVKEFKDEISPQKPIGWLRFVSRELIIGDQNFYLDQGRFTIICKVWFNGNEHECASKTRVTVNKQPQCNVEPLEFDAWFSELQKKHNKRCNTKAVSINSTNK